MLNIRERGGRRKQSDRKLRVATDGGAYQIASHDLLGCGMDRPRRGRDSRDVLVFVALDRGAASRHRIKNVVDEYIRFAYGHPVLDSGALAFIRAGARSLKNDREVRVAVNELMDRYGGVGRHPLGSRTPEILVKVRDLPAFLDELGVNAEHFDDVCKRYLG